MNKSENNDTEAANFKFSLRFAEKGNPKAMYDVACYYERYPKEYPGLYWEWLLKAAENGYDRAQIEVGDMYQEGKTPKGDFKVLIDHTKAAYWYERALSNSPDWWYAQEKLVSLYLHNSELGKQSYAVALLHKYVGDNDCFGKLLGEAYEQGIGTCKDEAKALHWYIVAAGYDDDFGIELAVKIAEMYTHGIGTKKDPIVAFDWLQRGTGFHGGVAEFKLGECYEHGNGCSVDLQEARKWYVEANRLWHSSAKERLIALDEKLRNKEGMDVKKS